LENSRVNRPTHASASERRRERFERIIFFAGFAFLLVFTGMLIARYQLFPYAILENATMAARAYAIQFGLISDVETGADALDGERFDALSGVTHHDSTLSAGGFTLFTSGDDEAANLIDMDGRVVHRWSLPVDALRERFGSDAIPDVPLGWRSTHLYPDGALLVVLQRRKFTPYGFALVKLDKDSQLLWANFDHSHHDVTVGEDGLIYTIGQAVRQDSIAGLDTLKPPFLEDFVLVVSEDGRTLHRISIMEAFADTPFASAVKQLVKGRDWKGDYFHVNAIEPYDSRREIPVIRKQQVLVSIRNMNALATVDLRTKKITWLLNGTWVRQHDPDIVDRRIILFDNRGDFSRGGRSRVLEFDPLTQQVTWQADVGQDYDLFSGWGASQQVLENGNVFITESAPGRLLELTRDGGLAWIYHTSGRVEGGDYAPPIQEARRYPDRYIEFNFNAQ
jgi:hypothetical protein